MPLFKLQVYECMHVIEVFFEFGGYNQHSGTGQTNLQNIRSNTLFTPSNFLVAKEQ